MSTPAYRVALGLRSFAAASARTEVEVTATLLRDDQIVRQMGSGYSDAPETLAGWRELFSRGGDVALTALTNDIEAEAANAAAAFKAALAACTGFVRDGGRPAEFPDLSALFELPRETIAELAANLTATADKADACLAKARAVLKERQDVAQMIAPWLEDAAVRLVQADPLASQDVLVDRLAACSARIYDAMAISMVRREDAAGIDARIRTCLNSAVAEVTP